MAIIPTPEEVNKLVEQNVPKIVGNQPPLTPQTVNEPFLAPTAPPPQTSSVPRVTASAGQASGSVVDFLSSKGFTSQKGEKFPLFDTRRSLFDKLGLNTQLGEFRGSAEQNTALLNMLRKTERESGVSLSIANINDVITGATASRTSATAPAIIPLYQAKLIHPEGSKQIFEVLTGGVLRGIGDENDPKFKELGGFASVRPVTQEEFAQFNQSQEEVKDFLPKIPTPEELANLALEKITGSGTFPLEKEAVEAEKAAIEVKAQRDKESLIQDMAARGLTFSGVRDKEVSALEADTLAQTLGVDRKFALLIATGLERAAQDIAKEAQAGRKEALDSLKALGYTVNPATGRLEQTLEGQRFDLSIAQEQRLQEQAEFDRQLDIARFELDKAKDMVSIQKALAEIQNLTGDPMQDIELLSLADRVETDDDFELEDVPTAQRGKVASILTQNKLNTPATTVEGVASRLKTASKLHTTVSLEDDELSLFILDDMNNGVSLEDTLANIEGSSVQNKDRAKEIVHELYTNKPKEEGGFGLVNFLIKLPSIFGL